MTTDDVYREIGRAHVERRELLQKVACLEDRMRSAGKALSSLVDNPLHADSVAAIEQARDPREDWTELKKIRDRLTELKKILDGGEA